MSQIKILSLCRRGSVCRKGASTLVVLDLCVSSHNYNKESGALFATDDIRVYEFSSNSVKRKLTSEYLENNYSVISALAISLSVQKCSDLLSLWVCW